MNDLGIKLVKMQKPKYKKIIARFVWNGKLYRVESQLFEYDFPLSSPMEHLLREFEWLREPIKEGILIQPKITDEILANYVPVDE